MTGPRFVLCCPCRYTLTRISFADDNVDTIPRGRRYVSPCPSPPRPPSVLLTFAGPTHSGWCTEIRGLFPIFRPTFPYTRNNRLYVFHHLFTPSSSLLYRSPGSRSRPVLRHYSATGVHRIIRVVRTIRRTSLIDTRTEYSVGGPPTFRPENRILRNRPEHEPGYYFNRPRYVNTEYERANNNRRISNALRNRRTRYRSFRVQPSNVSTKRKYSRSLDCPPAYAKRIVPFNSSLASLATITVRL